MALTKADQAFEDAAARALASDAVSVGTKPVTVNVLPKTPVSKMWPLQKDAIAYYGDPYNPNFMANLTHIRCPWKFKTGFEAGGGLITCHKKVADSLLRVLTKTWNDIQRSQDHAHNLGYDVFDGSYVVRPKRGGTSLSMHSFGVAFDFDAAHNQQHSLKHVFQRNTPLVDNFINEGAVWGGDWSTGSIDAMHFQFARVHA